MKFTPDFFDEISGDEAEGLPAKGSMDKAQDAIVGNEGLGWDHQFLGFHVHFRASKW